MKSFAVPFHEAGEHAILSFEVPDLERLQGEFGDDYIQRIFAGLDARHVGIIRRVLLSSLKAGDIETAISILPLDELCVRIADALYLRLYGRTISGGRSKSQKRS